MSAYNQQMKPALRVCCFLAAVSMFLSPARAEAYIGPGAGFAVVTSAYAIVITFLLVLAVLFAAPFRLLYGALFRRGRGAGVRRVVILGFDGMSPALVEEGMRRGDLPNFARLRESGGFSPLQTTFPAISPVAWSTFSTGMNPGGHNIFDFLAPDRRGYFPVLSSSEIGPPKRALKLGGYSISLGRPLTRNNRGGKTFWRILGERGIFSAVAHVPITFPPERFHGLMIAGMCLPDLKGSQGTFSFYTSGRPDDEFTGGERIPVSLDNGVVHTRLTGPMNPLMAKPVVISIPFSVKPLGGGKAVLSIQKQSIELRAGVYSDWVRVVFRAGFGVKIHGICRFLLRETEPEFKLYVTPINISPHSPSLPVTHPHVFSMYLAKALGSFATLGLPEDSWGLNEHVISPGEFLDQVELVRAEREKQLHLLLDKVKRGLVAMVFDTTDAVQHMFWSADGKSGVYDGELRELYKRMDEVLGRVMEKLGRDSVLFVMSDHGFASFERGVNVNTWLLKNGYLFLKDGATGNENYLRGVDWARTRAYAVGLGGLYLNLQGRESKGIVAPAEAAALKNEIAEKLEGMTDEKTGGTAIRKVYDTAKTYTGEYTANAPDLLIGCADGWRISWESVTGRLSDEVFSDNEKHWKGDHCVDPPLVPGVLFCSRKIDAANPSITDIAPSVLSLFGVEIPKEMDGKNLFARRDE